jgi:hypothetical protein
MFLIMGMVIFTFALAVFLSAVFDTVRGRWRDARRDVIEPVPHTNGEYVVTPGDDAVPA